MAETTKEERKAAKAAKEAEEATADDSGEEEEVLHTSDAAAHVEGVAIGDVAPDPTSPAGSDTPDYPFPVGGDVDVASVEQQDFEGETPYPIPADARVILGATDNVPEELQGAPALVVSTSEGEDDTGNPVQLVTVRTRDEHNSLVADLTRDDFDAVYSGGVGVRGFGA